MFQQFHITGNTSYTYAYKVLDLLNQERRKKGLTDLQMDAELLDAAMQRAVECYIYYNHQRPNGERCFTISNRMNRENIAMGYQSPEDVMSAWMNSAGHYDNIMAAENKSVGIGCVSIGRRLYWTQCFGNVTAVSAARPADQSKVYTVEAAGSIAAGLESTSGTISAGETIALKVIAVSETSRVIVGNDSYQWSSSKTGVAAVDKKGVITGKAAGTAVITGVNIGNPAKTLTYTVTVEEEMKKLTGWQKTGGIWYYYNANGVKQTGWQKLDGKWYYLDGSGAMQTRWCKVSGKWYYLGVDGVMRSGWQKLDGKWYYFDGSGVMQTTWSQIAGKWYYFGTDGAMRSGWQKISTKWYYLDSSGVMQIKWCRVGGRWYYLGTDGAMRSGWQKISAKWYYLDGSGAMQTGWCQIGGKWYYLGTNGVMRTRWQKADNKWYYLDDSGVMQTGWLKLDGQWYYFKADGAMVSTDTYIAGKKHKFNSKGVWLGAY